MAPSLITVQADLAKLRRQMDSIANEVRSILAILPGEPLPEVSHKLVEAKHLVNDALNDIDGRVTRVPAYPFNAEHPLQVTQPISPRPKKRKSVPSQTANPRPPLVDVDANTSTMSTPNHSSEPAPKKPKGGLASPRRPTAENAFYSYMTKNVEHWEQSNRAHRMFLSHVGRIEETDAGMLAPEPCDICKRGNRPCRVYKEEFAGKYFMKGTTNNWRACGECRHRGYACSIAEDARSRNPTKKEKEEDEALPVIMKYTMAGLRCPSDEVIRAEIEANRREIAIS